jgi:hypothetical protein
MERKRLLGNMNEKKDVITDHAQEAIINQLIILTIIQKSLKLS